MKQGRGREELLGGKVIHATDQHNSVVHTSILGVVGWWGWWGAGGDERPQRLHLISHCHGLTAGFINWLHIIASSFIITY